MKIFSSTVGKNEAHRYFKTIAAHMEDAVDHRFFYDDSSTDGTPDVARAAGYHVYERISDEPEFMDDEGVFREYAWLRFSKKMEPQEGDWVMTIDCDQLLISSYPGISTREALGVTVAAADRSGCTAVSMHIFECFGFDTDGCPLIRTDGQWGQIDGPMLFKYQGHGNWRYGRFGVPGQPSYVFSGSQYRKGMVAYVHYGYAHPDDRQEKYDRYHGEPSHSGAHIDSILTPDSEMTLERWQGAVLHVVRQA